MSFRTFINQLKENGKLVEIFQSVSPRLKLQKLQKTQKPPFSSMIFQVQKS